MKSRLPLAVVLLMLVGCDEAAVSSRNGAVVLAWRPADAAYPHWRHGVVVSPRGVLWCNDACRAVIGPEP